MKGIKTVLVGLAVLIALSYTFGYDYIYRAISKTYLQGETSAFINDGDLFPSHLVGRGTPKPWPKSAGYNQKKLSETLSKNLKETNTTAFLIIKNDQLLHEEYWDGGSAAKESNSFSMAKAVTIMLLGEAISDKRIKNENQLYSAFYGNYARVDYGNKLTLKHLASMEAGLNWTENYTNPFMPNAKAYFGKSLAEATFRKSFKETPGTKFEYQSGATQLLGFAIRKATNVPLASYLSKKIWAPVGMEQNAHWSVDDNGMEKTFCCLHSKARDFAKLGQLLLDNGKSGTVQVLDSVWVNKMRTPTALSKGAYGMGLWINNDNPIKHYYFWGLYGQYIIVVPEKQMIIVRLGEFKNQPKDTKGRPEQVAFLVNEVAKNF